MNDDPKLQKFTAKGIKISININIERNIAGTREFIVLVQKLSQTHESTIRYEKSSGMEFCNVGFTWFDMLVNIFHIFLKLLLKRLWLIVNR